jgi:mycofactocin precursor
LSITPEQLEETAVEPQPVEEPEDGELVLEDVVIEDISIDGMCGVY